MKGRMEGKLPRFIWPLLWVLLVFAFVAEAVDTFKKWRRGTYER